MVNRAVELDQRRNGTWLDHRFVWSGSCKSSNGVHGLPSREDEIFDLIAEVPRIGVRIRCTCSQLCIGKLSKCARSLSGGMWQTRHSARRCGSHRQCGRNRATLLDVGRAGGAGKLPRAHWIDGRRRAASKAPQRKRPCRSRVPSVDPRFAALNPFYGDRSRMRWGGALA